MNKIIESEKLDIIALVNSNANKEILSEVKYCTLVEKMNDEFTEEQQKWYIANMYMYVHYHPKKDFPIDFDKVWKFIGFANKGNAKRLLENRFIKDVNYQIVFLPKEKNPNGGRPDETIMLSVETFKKFCMFSNTKVGEEIREYYIKLENINNEIIKDELNAKILELEEQKMKHHELLENKEQQLKEKQKIINLIKNKPELYGFHSRKGGYVYIFKDTSRPGHIKIGFSSRLYQRITSMNCASSCSTIEVYRYYYVFDMKFAEDVIHHALYPLKIKTESNRNEWFYVENDDELVYVVDTMEKCISFIELYNIKELNLDTIDNAERICNIDDQNKKSQKIWEENKIQILTKNAQFTDARTGKYKGVCFDKIKNKWDSSIIRDGKHIFLGYYETEEEAAKVYNDYASFLNETQNQKYTINYIPGYITNPRDVIYENRKKIFESKTSKYIGVKCCKERYRSTIVYQTQIYDLGSGGTERECAILYNKQAMYFNETFGTSYTLNEIPDYENVAEDVYSKIAVERKQRKTNKYTGVRLTADGKYNARIGCNHIGNFDTEAKAAEAYNERAIELNKSRTTKLYKLNVIDY